MKQYLGDGVYIDVDGDHLVLTTEYGNGPTNVIYLDPDVFSALHRYVEQITPPTADGRQPGLFKES